MKLSFIISIAFVLGAVRGLADASLGFDPNTLKQRVLAIAPQAQFGADENSLRIEFKSEKRRVFPTLKSGKKGTQQILIDDVKQDGLVLEVFFLREAYNGAMIRPSVLDLSPPKSEEKVPYFRTAADGRVYVNVTVGQKTDPALVRKLYKLLFESITGLPKLAA